MVSEFCTNIDHFCQYLESQYSYTFTCPFCNTTGKLSYGDPFPMIGSHTHGGLFCPSPCIHLLPFEGNKWNTDDHDDRTNGTNTTAAVTTVATVATTAMTSAATATIVTTAAVASATASTAVATIPHRCQGAATNGCARKVKGLCGNCQLIIFEAHLKAVQDHAQRHTLTTVQAAGVAKAAAFVASLPHLKSKPLVKKAVSAEKVLTAMRNLLAACSDIQADPEQQGVGGSASQDTGSDRQADGGESKSSGGQPKRQRQR